MNIAKVRFVEPGNRPYRASLKNFYTYDRYIRNPSHGMLTLATIVKPHVPDTYMYSESISNVVWDDVLDADIVFIGIFTFSALRGYELARYVKEHSDALVVMGGLHASLNYPEAVQHCDYVLLGEGDETILQFIDALRHGGPLDFPGLAYMRGDEVVCTGKPEPPENIDTIPDRNLLYRYRAMAGHNTIWPQVHASRGCPHACDYCAVVCHLGRRVRKRSPENVVEDIRQAVAFFDKTRMPRPCPVLWISDDNFFADRQWAMSVLHAMIDSGITYRYTIQARYEVGLDDEMLELLEQAGFMELAFGIEFLEDESFETYHKQSSRSEIVRAIRNTQAHGIRVRGLFIFGSDCHTKGVGKRVADFVEENDIRGVLLQSMYFVPGTPVYETGKDRLLHENWSLYSGHVVHRPKHMTPAELQLEIIDASSRIYSKRNLLRKLLREPLLDKALFVGEYFWHKSIRSDLKAELPELEAYGARGTGQEQHAADIGQQTETKPA